MKELYDLPFSPNAPFKHWEEIKKRAQSNNSRKSLLICNFLDLVEKDFKYREGKTIEIDFAQKLNYSASNLGKICRDIIQISPSDCIKVRLIAEACKLLENPIPTVKMIADDLGFEGQASYFSKLFKNYTGLTPMGFRKAI